MLFPVLGNAAEVDWLVAAEVEADVDTFIDRDVLCDNGSLIDCDCDNDSLIECEMLSLRLIELNSLMLIELLSLKLFESFSL